MTRAKICGLSTPAAVAAALAGEAAFVGFMFFDASPRCVTPEAAASLAGPARGKARIVAVAVDPDDALLDRVMNALRPDLIQLHGKESPARARQIADRAGVGVIKVVAVSEAADLAAAEVYEGVAEHLMFDARTSPAASRPGGMGSTFDWDLLAGQTFKRPWFLAGGLDPWNVGEAVRRSGAPMVDVSSGVERGPGLKDPALIHTFLEAVRRG